MAYTAKKVPAYLALSKDAKGVVTLIDGTDAPAERRFPSADGLLVAKMLKTLLEKGQQVNEYAFYCPKYGKDGKIVYQTDTKGHVILTPKGKARVEMVELARAIKEAEEGSRVATVRAGFYGTYKVNMMPPTEAKVSDTKEKYVDISFLLGQ